MYVAHPTPEVGCFTKLSKYSFFVALHEVIEDILAVCFEYKTASEGVMSKTVLGVF